MENCQEIYTMLTKKLESLEENLGVLKEYRDVAVREYKEIKNKFIKLEKEITELKCQTNGLPNSENLKISFIIAMIMILVSGALLVLLSEILILSFVGIQAVIFKILSTSIIFTLIRFFGVKSFKKLQYILQKKAYNRFIKTDKYKHMFLKIKVLEKELNEVLDEEVMKKNNMRTADNEYNTCLAEISMKKSLVNYIENEMNSMTEEENKVYVRRRIKNGDNVGNIQ